MPCTELRPVVGWRAGLGLSLGLALLDGCSRQSAPVASAAAAPLVQRANDGASSPEASFSPSPVAPQHATAELPQRLPPPGRVRDIDELRRQAAHRIVAANPHGTYLGAVPAALLAIPVLEIELRHDGSVARISVLRAPRQARDTTAIAMAAVRRAAPFGDVSHLRPPWRFTETFLFNDDRKFKPRILDE